MKRRILIVLITPLLLVLSAASYAADPPPDLVIIGPTNPSEDNMTDWAVESIRRPLSNDADGYRPTGMADPGGGVPLPTVYEKPVEFRWNFGDGSGWISTGERPSIRHIFKDDGDMTVSVEARTDDGPFATVNKNVTVKNRKPLDPFIYAVEIDPANGTFELTADASDAEGDPLQITWDFGDGEQLSGPLADVWRQEHSYPIGGTYPVTVTFDDEDGSIRTKTTEVVVIDGRGTSDDRVDPFDDTEPAEGVSTKFEAAIGGSFSTAFKGKIRPLAGIFLGPLGGGRCRFMLTAWDPSRLVSVNAILDLAGIPEEGGARYTFSRPNIDVNFDPDASRFDVSETLMLQLFKNRGFGEIIAPITAPLDDRQKQDIANKVGVAPGAREDQGEFGPPAATSPFGVEDHEGFETRGGRLVLDLLPRQRAIATFDLSLVNTDKESSYPSITFKGEFAMDLAAARRDGIFLWDQCGPATLEVEHVAPEDDERHVWRDRPRIRVRFSEAYDVTTLDESTFQLTYPDAASGEPVSVAVRLHRLDNRATIKPLEALWGGVTYTARIKAGEDGVRGRNGAPIEDEDGSGWYTWKFTTRLDLEPGPGESENLSCHVIQTVRDAPLIPGKPTVTRVYAHWNKRPEVAASAQMQEMISRVILHDGGTEIASVAHAFVRPDLWASRGVDQKTADHTANIFWTPDESTGSSVRIAIEVQRKADEEHKKTYWTRCPTTMWDLEPELTYEYYTLAVNGWEEDDEAAAAQALVSQIAIEAETLVEQMYPLRHVYSRPGGILRKPLLDQFGGPCDKACAANLVTHHGGGSQADIIIAFLPHDDLNGGGRAYTNLGQGGPAVVVITAKAEPAYMDRYIESVVHEIGHTLWLQHLPFVNEPERESIVSQRDRAWENGGQPNHWHEGIEGFRIARDGKHGWNKSSTEGNEEGSWLTPLMYPGTIPYRETFIVRHQYLSTMEALESRGGVP